MDHPMDTIYDTVYDTISIISGQLEPPGALF